MKNFQKKDKISKKKDKSKKVHSPASINAIPLRSREQKLSSNKSNSAHHTLH
jgi:hypothetical protein